uniref:Uncharacterized protein n=1 Tax=viral metagenome TaxID=1070528 RepID=A0A6C0E0X9_9ZZZZ
MALREITPAPGNRKFSGSKSLAHWQKYELYLQDIRLVPVKIVCCRGCEEHAYMVCSGCDYHDLNHRAGCVNSRCVPLMVPTSICVKCSRPPPPPPIVYY